MPFYYYFDPYYWIILMPAFLIALLAQLNVSATFNRYSRIASRRGLTGAQAAEAVLRANGVYGVRIERVAGKLSDHYDPRTNVIRLSDGVYGSNSIASVGVAAHEAGHAVQYAQAYGPIKVRGAIIPVCNFSSQISILLIILGCSTPSPCSPWGWCSSPWPLCSRWSPCRWSLTPPAGRSAAWRRPACWTTRSCGGPKKCWEPPP